MVDAPRKASSTLIQGTGADIFRFVIRELTTHLAPHGAYIVHVLHDEIVLSCPDDPATIDTVKTILKTTMETAGQRSGLIPDPTLLFAIKGPYVGKTLADIT